MKDHRLILRNVGWVFIAVGAIDIVFMAYCIFIKVNYHSSFNIFAIIAGVFLLKGNLKAARILAWFTALSIAALIGNIVLMPFLYPVDLLLTSIKLGPVNSLVSAAVFLAGLVFSVWSYRELTSEPVQLAIEGSNDNTMPFLRQPVRGFWIGGCLILIVAVFLHMLMSGATAAQVKQRAAVQAGDGYKFHIKSINMSSNSRGKSTYAIVTAYNNVQIKDIVVQWSE